MADTDQAKPRPPIPRWRRWLLDGLILLTLFAAFQLWQARHAPRGAAPQFAGQRVDGQPFDLAAWRAEHPGRATLLYFWADWCPICKTTAGSVGNIGADWPVIGIATQSGPSAQVARFMQRQGYDWPALPDRDGDIMRRYGLPATPSFVIIDPAGNVRFVSLGYTSEIGLRLRLWWASRGAS